MSNLDKIQPEWLGDDSVYSPELFTDLTKIVFTDEITLAQITAGQSPIARWSPEHGKSYVLSQVPHMDNGSYSNMLELQEYATDKPVQELVAEYTVLVNEDGSYRPINSTGHFDEFPNQEAAQYTLSRQAVEALMTRANELSPAETYRVAKKSYDKAFLRAVGTILLSDFAVRDGIRDHKYEITDRDVYLAIDSHDKRMRSIPQEEYWQTRNSSEFDGTKITKIRVAGYSRPEDGTHESTYLRDLNKASALLHIAMAVSENMDNEWSTTINKDIDLYDSIANQDNRQ